MKESDVAYTILTGLGEKYSSLVTTLTNMITPEKPLTITRVTEAILTEELRIKGMAQTKSEQNADNPLAFKHDTSFKGSLSSALVACSYDHHPYRHAPYPRGNHIPYRGRGCYVDPGRHRPSYPFPYHPPRPQPPWTPNGAWSPTQPTWTPNGTWPPSGEPYSMGPPRPPTTALQTQRQTTQMRPPLTPITPQPPTNIQCYGCGMWGHMRRNCYYEHPELHPFNRACMLAQMNSNSHPTPTPTSRTILVCLRGVRRH